MKLLALGILLVALPAGEARGEEPARWLALPPGTHVRFIVEDGGPIREIAGRLRGADEAAVTVDTASGPRRLERDTLRHLRYRTGGRDRKKGAAIGAAITGMAGFIAGIVIGARELPEGGGSCEQCGIAVGFIGVATGVATAIPGGVVGFAVGAPGSDWRNAKPDGLTVGGGRASRASTVALRWRPGQGRPR